MLPNCLSADSNSGWSGPTLSWKPVERLSDPDIPDAEAEAEVGEYVETMLDWTRQYIAFLKECGGCEAA